MEALFSGMQLLGKEMFCGTFTRWPRSGHKWYKSCMMTHAFMILDCTTIAMTPKAFCIGNTIIECMQDYVSIRYYIYIYIVNLYVLQTGTCTYHLYFVPTFSYFQMYVKQFLPNFSVRHRAKTKNHVLQGGRNCERNVSCSTLDSQTFPFDNGFNGCESG